MVILGAYAIFACAPIFIRQQTQRPASSLNHLANWGNFYSETTLIHEIFQNSLPNR